MNADDANNCGLFSAESRCRTLRELKSRAAFFMLPGKIARSGEEKAGDVPASRHTVELPQKFQKKSIVTKKLKSMAAMQLLHCTIVTNHLYAGRVEGK
ncbi:hypothetical protein [Mesorhizobium sp.]|uniref:hypothetical protein n=1 Tax=Mesorhizobium sp. TaxID=1871066 RepID=UPI000FE3E4A6|nr:hypothetical protein [Mesorhizobium sp.]RWK08525.1 MAG: hypothetical protein EOR42_04525 [Mesorhizobium sp.]